ncbi:MAG: hypothetical protein LUD57_06705 [Ruminococcus sp.]|nr:hypothetical protein [Ruminococcus sp.]
MWQQSELCIFQCVASAAHFFIFILKEKLKVIDTNTLPPSVQKSLKLNNTIRKVTLMISWGLVPILFIVCCIISIASGAFFDELLLDVEIAIWIGCTLHGLVHVAPICKAGCIKLKGIAIGFGILFGGLFIMVPFALWILFAA